MALELPWARKIGETRVGAIDPHPPVPRLEQLAPPPVEPNRPQLGGLEASWGVLWLSLGSREPFCFPSHFRSFFGCHFASTLDPKTTPKSQKRETKSLAKTRKEKRLISMLLPLKFEEILMLKPKKTHLQKLGKTMVCLCIF